MRTLRQGSHGAEAAVGRSDQAKDTAGTALHADQHIGARAINRMHDTGRTGQLAKTGRRSAGDAMQGCRSTGQSASKGVASADMAMQAGSSTVQVAEEAKAKTCARGEVLAASRAAQLAEDGSAGVGGDAYTALAIADHVTKAADCGAKDDLSTCGCAGERLQVGRRHANMTMQAGRIAAQVAEGSGRRAYGDLTAGSSARDAAEQGVACANLGLRAWRG